MELTDQQELDWAIHNDHADGAEPNGECPECGSPDIDIATDSRYDFECKECGCKF
jgi:hypothetical protein